MAGDGITKAAQSIPYRPTLEMIVAPMAPDAEAVPMVPGAEVVPATVMVPLRVERQVLVWTGERERIVAVGLGQSKERWRGVRRGGCYAAAEEEQAVFLFYVRSTLVH